MRVKQLLATFIMNLNTSFLKESIAVTVCEWCLVIYTLMQVLGKGVYFSAMMQLGSHLLPPTFEVGSPTTEVSWILTFCFQLPSKITKETM